MLSAFQHPRHVLGSHTFNVAGADLLRKTDPVLAAALRGELSMFIANMDLEMIARLGLIERA